MAPDSDALRKGLFFEAKGGGVSFKKQLAFKATPRPPKNHFASSPKDPRMP